MPMLNHIHKIHFNNTDDGRQAMHKEWVVSILPSAGKAQLEVLCHYLNLSG